jgi:hypothetical protein
MAVFEPSVSLQTQTNIVVANVPIHYVIQPSESLLKPTIIVGLQGGDQVIITITQEVFRRKFNSGFQNS